MKQTEFNKEANNRMAAGLPFTSTTIKKSMGLAGVLTVGEVAAELRVPVRCYKVASPAAAPMGANQKGQCGSCACFVLPTSALTLREAP